MTTTTKKIQPLSYPDRDCAAYAGISNRLWEELKKNHPKILTPCITTTSGRKYYLAKDIEAALILNKTSAQTQK